MKYSETIKTGGGEPPKIILQPVEERLLDVIGSSAMDGDGKTPEADVKLAEAEVNFSTKGSKS